jgi:hypothetical protein
MGSTVVRAVLAYDGLPCSSLVEKRPVRWDVAASGGHWKMARGGQLSPVKGVKVGKAEAWWQL